MTKTLTDLLNFAKSRNVPETIVGYAIMIAVVNNKDRNKDVYNQGTNRSNYFKKLEANAIHSGLEKLMRDSICPLVRSHHEPKDELLGNTNLRILGEGEIFTMNFVYDALMYFSSKKIPLDDIATIMGSAAYDVPRQQQDQGRQVDLRQGYYDFLMGLRKRISEKFKVYL
ncbi:MAG: hypothetical protein V1866_04110 [archaeon]